MEKLWGLNNSHSVICYLSSNNSAVPLDTRLHQKVFHQVWWSVQQQVAQTMTACAVGVSRKEAVMQPVNIL